MGKRGEYVRVGDRDTYTLVDPLDYLILQELPDEGELMGGYYPVAETVKNLRKTKFPQLDVNLLTGRVRGMGIYGLTVKVNLAGGAGWQITKKGKEVLAAWQQQQNKP